MGDPSPTLLADALGLDKGHMICTVGAGGKTSLVYHLARELKARGLRVLVSSTTHMASGPQPPGFRLVEAGIFEENREEVNCAHYGGEIPVLLRREEGERLGGLEPGEISALRNCMDVIVVEGDGARFAAFKIPRDHEPVVPPGTTHLAIMMGLPALDKPISDETCFHPDMFAPVAEPGMVLTPELARTLLYADGGYLRYADEGMRLSVIINQADDEEGRGRAIRAARSFYHPSVSDVLVTRLKEPAWFRKVDNGDGPLWGILLAAGEGKRSGGEKLFWTDGAGRTLVQRSLDNALWSTLDGVVMVLGHRADEIRSSLRFAGPRLRVVENPDFPSGMASSIRAGLEGLPGDVGGAAILLADQPRVGSSLIDSVASAFKGSLAKIARPVAKGRGGHPVIFRRDMFDALARLQGDEGGRSLLEVGREYTLLVPWSSLEDFGDIDTPEDLASLKS